MTLILVDGSRLVGNSTIESFELQTTDGTKKITVPLSQVLHIKTKKHGREEIAAIVTKKDDKTNKIRGVIDLQSVELETIFGNVDIDIVHLRKLLVVRAYTENNNQGEDGTIAFGGVHWHPWRTAFEIQGDRLVSLPQARPGFDYGHGGHGRGAALSTNVGNTEWRDYSVTFKVGMPGLDRSFNPYGLPEIHEAKFIAINFHVADAKESWNDRGLSAYRLNLAESGRVEKLGSYKWRLAKTYNSYSNRQSGWGNLSREGQKLFFESDDGTAFEGMQGATVRIDVIGKHIKAWVNGEKVADLIDEEMGSSIGGQTLDHGGIVIETPWEDMIWISDFSFKPL